MRIEKPIGKYSEEQAKRNLKKAIPIVVISYAFVLLTSLSTIPTYLKLGKWAPICDFVAGAVFMYGITQFIVPYSYWKSGLSGERAVIDNISPKLGNEHSLFNDVMLKDGKRSGNMDHIIVGPRGIFVLETKNIRGRFTVNGDNWKGLRRSPSVQAKNNARRLHHLLTELKIFGSNFPYVEAAVVLPNNKAQLDIEKKPENCQIIQIRDRADNSLYEWIMSHQRSIFASEEIEIIVEFLKSKII